MDATVARARFYSDLRDTLPVSQEARDWAIQHIQEHGHYDSLDDLLQQAEKLAVKFTHPSEVDGSR
jgi:hypothetical protein